MPVSPNDITDEMTRVATYGTSQQDRLAALLNLPEVRQIVAAAEQREHADMMAALPGWDDMSDLDKGAALPHMHKRVNEGDDYAIENYPAKFIEDPRLTGLSRDDACAHVARLFPYEDDYDDLREENGDEAKRLYDLALNHEQGR
jgi:hypothetical protein